jgi:tetratricopeptide (TPR) repeat protein
MHMAVLLRRFPVQVALAALLVYTLTLSHGVTLASLPLTAKLAGWDWQPLNTQPLLWLLTLPLRLLPTSWLAVALNFFSALCAALTLGILARSMELLAWDRPLPTLAGWRAKLPILLACSLCGLEFNFWQEATAATGEMLQILLFAIAVLGLLEYRVARDLRWLQAATFFWGIGMAENWMMMLMLPLFVLALFWLGKFDLLQKEILLRLGIAGLAGFSIFILLPMVNGLSPYSPWSFGEAWHNTLKNFKHLYANIHGGFWLGHRLTTFAVLVFFLVPVLPGVVRLPDEGTQNKSGLDQFQVWLYRSLRAALLLACLWLAFDPVVGPRQLVFKQVGLSLPFLSLDYLLGLGAGYLAGNLLLALMVKPKDDYRQPNFLETYSERAAVPGFVILLVMVAATLLLRGAPAIMLANRQPLQQFGEFALRSLPTDGGIVLSDDPEQLLVFQAAGKSRQWLALDTTALPLPAYRQQLAKKNSGEWFTQGEQGNLAPAGMLKLIGSLAQKKQIYYLQHSFGYLFEFFYSQPVGPVFALQFFADKTIQPPPLNTTAIARTEKLWNDFAPRLEAIEKTCAPQKAGWLEDFYAHLHWQAVPPLQSRLLGDWYAVALNNWGVQLQQAGQLAAAQKRFEQALALNPKNPAAQINLQCNTNLAAGAKLNLAAVDTLAGQLNTVPRISRFVSAFGMVDEPSFCYLLGNAFQQINLPRQALQQFERARVLAPTVLAPQIALAELYTRCGFNEQARAAIQDIRQADVAASVKNNLDVGLSLLEVNSWLAQTNTTNARSVLQSVLQAHPNDARAENLVLRTYLAFGDYTNALRLVQHQLASQPDNFPGLVNLAGIYLQLGQFSNALPVYDRALAISNYPPARLSRAVARVETARYAEAEDDYRELQKTATNNLPIYFGLAEIASRQHDTNRAVDYLERCLAAMPADSPQRTAISTRINQLKSPAAKP